MDFHAELGQKKRLINPNRLRTFDILDEEEFLRL